MTKLMVKSGRHYRSATRAEIAEAFASVVLVEFNKERPLLDGPGTSRRVLIDILAGRPYEVFMVLFLDTRHRLIEAKEMFRGTIDGASVHPREVVREALCSGAAAVLLAHNHPSGVAEPSQADELITLRLKEALALVDVRLLDHLIIGGQRCVSLAERGVL